MSEEEILEWVNSIISNLYMNISTQSNVGHTFNNNDFYRVKALQCLLDLYKQEKEKNDKLQKEIEELNIENINLKRKQIIDKSSIPNQENFYDYYNFISKDKIKELVEHIEACLEGCYMAEPEYDCSRAIGIYNDIVERLQNLLKEGN